MKKTILTLLCCAILIVIVACSKNDDINLEAANAVTDTTSKNIQQYENVNNKVDNTNISSPQNNAVSAILNDNLQQQYFLNYNDILNRYRYWLSNNCNTTETQFSFENDCIIEDALYSVAINSNTSCMGYAIDDLNDDGNTELLLLDEQYNIYAIFSQINETPVLLDVFSLNNNYVSLDKNGIFYKTGYGKGENSYTKIMQISDNGEFEILLEYGCYDDGIDREYYVVEQNVKRVITLQDILVLQEHYSVFLKNPSNITRNSGILFIPII